MADTPKEFQEKMGELESAEDRPLEAEQLAAINQVVVTLSHGINNPLAGILGAIEVLLGKKQGLPAEAQEVLVGIKQEAEKIKNIMSQLKD